MITYLAHGYTYSTLTDRVLDAMLADPANGYSIYSIESHTDLLNSLKLNAFSISHK